MTILNLPKNTLLISVMLLVACRASDRPLHVGDVELYSGEPVEYETDFPLSDYLTYDDGVTKISYPQSLDLKFPFGYVLESSLRLGSINAADETLPYQIDTTLSVPYMTDFVLEESSLLFSDGGSSIYEYSKNGQTLNTWKREGASFSEVAYDDEYQAVWAFDSANHRIYHTPKMSPTWQYWTIQAELDIFDLRVLGDQLAVAWRKDMQVAIELLSIETLEPEGSLKLNDLNVETISEALPMPDGRWLTSSLSDENNLVILAKVASPEEEGPIEAALDLEYIGGAQLPNEIEQPSSLQRRSDGSWMVLTDQADIFILSDNFSDVLSKYSLTFDSISCNQGCTEGLGLINDEHFYVVTDGGVVAEFSLEGGELHGLFEYEISLDEEWPNFSGITYDPENNRAYMITDSEDALVTDHLYSFDTTNAFMLVNKVPVFSNESESVNAFDAEDIVIENGKLYVVSEQFTKILVLSTEGEITEVYDFTSTEIADPSGLFVEEGDFFIIGDHESDEPVPPVQLFALP